MGYRVLSDYFQAQSDSKLEAKLDLNDYDESQLIELRVKLNLPYYIGQDYQRYDGEIELEGIHYKYVKRKVENGELVLLCLPNQEKQKIQEARDGFFEMVNDLEQNTSGKKSDSGNSLVFKIFLVDYKQESNDWSLNCLPEKNSFNSIYNTAISNSRHALIPEQPPECWIPSCYSHFLSFFNY